MKMKNEGRRARYEKKICRFGGSKNGVNRHESKNDQNRDKTEKHIKQDIKKDMTRITN